MIRRLTLNLTASGSAGTATASETTASRIHGLIKAVYLDHSSGAATTDTTVDAEAPAISLVSIANSVTDAAVYPTVELTDAGGTGLSAYTDISLSGQKITAALAQANDAQTCAVTIVWDDLR